MTTGERSVNGCRRRVRTRFDDTRERRSSRWGPTPSWSIGSQVTTIYKVVTALAGCHILAQGRMKVETTFETSPHPVFSCSRHPV